MRWWGSVCTVHTCVYGCWKIQKYESCDRATERPSQQTMEWMMSNSPIVYDVYVYINCSYRCTTLHHYGQTAIFVVAAGAVSKIFFFHVIIKVHSTNTYQHYIYAYTDTHLHKCMYRGSEDGKLCVQSEEKMKERNERTFISLSEHHQQHNQHHKTCAKLSSSSFSYCIECVTQPSP